MRTPIAVLALAIVVGAACSDGDDADTADREVRTSATTPATTTTSPPAGFDVAAVLDGLIGDGDGGVAVTLVRDGVTESYAAGVADTGGTPLAPTDRFRVGSLGKPFVATVVMQLAEEGALDLDAPYDTYVTPAFDVAEVATVRQLLGHASGLPDYTQLRSFPTEVVSDLDREWTAADLVAEVTDAEPRFAPGTSAEYSNTNYVVLGQIVEAVTGSTLADQVETRIAAPLGLADTWFPDDDRPADVVTGWSAALGGPTEGITYTSVETSAGAAGSLVSSAPDLARFLTALFDGSLVSADSLAQMTDPAATTGYGLGLLPAPFPTGPAFTHNGAIPGYEAVMGIQPDSGQVVVILANSDLGDFGQIALAVLQIA